MDQQTKKNKKKTGGGEKHGGASIAPMTAKITTTFIVCRPRMTESIMEYSNF